MGGLARKIVSTITDKMALWAHTLATITAGMSGFTNGTTTSALALLHKRTIDGTCSFAAGWSLRRCLLCQLMFGRFAAMYSEARSRSSLHMRPTGIEATCAGAILLCVWEAI